MAGLDRELGKNGELLDLAKAKKWLMQGKKDSPCSFEAVVPDHEGDNFTERRNPWLKQNPPQKLRQQRVNFSSDVIHDKNKNEKYDVRKELIFPSDVIHGRNKTENNDVWTLGWLSFCKRTGFPANHKHCFDEVNQSERAFTYSISLHIERSPQVIDLCRTYGWFLPCFRVELSLLEAVSCVPACSCCVSMAGG